MTLRSLGVALVALLALASVPGCGETLPPTQIMVTIDGEPGVRTRAREVRVRVFGASPEFSGVPSELIAEYPFAVTSGMGWPRVVALAPQNRDPRRRFMIEAVALETSGAETGFATVRAISGYVEGQTLSLRLLLQDSCIGVECTSTDLSCRDGSCVRAEIDPRTLPPFASDAGASDMDAALGDGGTRDAGMIDGAARDGGMDAGGGGDGGGECDPARCDDGLGCTEDVCGAMGCEHIARGSRCDDANPCTVDVCDPMLDCTHAPIEAGTTCTSDGSFCNGAEICDALGACVSPGNPCMTPLTCDEGADRCVGCTLSTDCPAPSTTRGACTYSSDLCAPGQLEEVRTTYTCAAGSCEASSSSTFIACTPMVAEGGSCGAPACGGWGTCTSPSTCSLTGMRSRPCADRLCRSSTCTTVPRTEVGSCMRTTNGLACDDSNPCTTGSACSAGMCSGGMDLCSMDGGGSAPCQSMPTLCDPADVCVDGFCDPFAAGADSNGCVYMPNGSCMDAGMAPCEMSPSLCLASPCVIAMCDPSSGSADANGCTFEPDPSCMDAGVGGCVTNPDCNDSDPCTSDMCSSGLCSYFFICDTGTPRDSGVREAGVSPG